MRIVEMNVYEFSELNDKAKERARNRWREEYEFSPDLEGVKSIAEILGISDIDISYAGFSHQGDGASFTGFYSYRANSCSDIRRLAPKDKELHRIADTLEFAQNINENKLQARIRRSEHRYLHEYTVCIDVHRTDGKDIVYCDVAFDATDDGLQSFMRWIYKEIQDQYEYSVSDEQIDENFTEIGYEFDRNGNVFVCD